MGWADCRLESAGPGSRSRRSVRDLIVISCSGAGGGQVFARARHVDGRAASLPRSDARCACHVDGRLLRASSVSAPWRAPVRRGHTCRHHVRGSARFIFSVRSGHLGALREHVLIQEEKAGRIRGHPDVLDRPRHVDAVEFGARQRAERRVPEGEVPRYIAEMRSPGRTLPPASRTTSRADLGAYLGGDLGAPDEELAEDAERVEQDERRVAQPRVRAERPAGKVPVRSNVSRPLSRA